MYETLTIKHKKVLFLMAVTSFVSAVSTHTNTTTATTSNANTTLLFTQPIVQFIQEYVVDSVVCYSRFWSKQQVQVCTTLCTLSHALMLLSYNYDHTTSTNTTTSTSKKGKSVPDREAPEPATDTTTAPAPNRIKKKGLILDTDVTDVIPTTSTSTTNNTNSNTNTTNTTADSTIPINTDSSIYKLANISKLHRSSSASSSTSLSDVAGGADIVNTVVRNPTTNTGTITASNLSSINTSNNTTNNTSHRRIAKKDVYSVEAQVRADRGKWVKELDKKIDKIEVSWL